MEDGDLITGLADIEAQLKAGNACQEKLAQQIGALAAALRGQQAPNVTVQPQIAIPPAPQPMVHVMPAAPAAAAGGFDYEHEHQYDEIGRCVKTISRVVKGARNG